MKHKLFTLLLLGPLSILSSQLATFAQGSLTPPGAPAATMKSLDQIEPRTPISSLPFNITNGGSYYLTGSLTSAAGGITIQANEVTLDLMGFALAGGNGSGISVSGARTNIVIRNGTVRGWTTNGIEASSAMNSQLEELRISSNGGFGVRAGAGIVSKCEAYKNGAEGIYTSGSIIRDCLSHNNGSHGIIVDFDSTIVNCVARQNTGAGIISIYGVTVTGCSANFNTAAGISAGDGSTVTICSAKANGTDGIVGGTGSTINGCTVTANTSDGIEVSSSCRIADNTCQGNTGAGINATASRNRIDSNNVMGNGTGIKCNPGTANLIIRNSARSNTTANYDIVAGNNSGATILSPGVGFSSSNPWANFEF
jgi:parallel beta-helix repeat protein